MTKQKRDELLGRLGAIDPILEGTTSHLVLRGTYVRPGEAACIRILRDVLADVVREMDTQDRESSDRGAE